METDLATKQLYQRLEEVRHHSDQHH